MTTATGRRKAARKTAPAILPQSDLGPIEMVPLDLLKPYAGNARTHDDRQLAKIGQSLQAFGWMNPIIAEGDGTIIAGHGRWSAAKGLGLTQAPVLRVAHLTPDAARAYRIADNRLAELGGWDEETLAIELQHLSNIDLDFNIEVIGFDHAEIDLMLDPQEKNKGEQPLDPADEDVMAPQPVATSRLGDLWLLGEHRLLCGSCIEAEGFAVLMNGKQATMVFQDAPYNCKVDGHVSGLGKTKHREFAMASGEMSDGEFRTFLVSNLQLATGHLVDGGVLALCMDWRQSLNLQLAMAEVKLELINMAVWAKTAAGMGSLYRSQHELVFIARRGRTPHINNVELGRHGRFRTNLWRYAGVNGFGRGRMAQLKDHPTPKPVAMVADAIRDVTHRGQIVFDGFMGSGTTLLAAERTGRIGYGIDIDPLDIDVTIRRWQQMTGQEAVLAATGQRFAEVTAERAGA